jgi:WD40 repeat protein
MKPLSFPTVTAASFAVAIFAGNSALRGEGLPVAELKRDTEVQFATEVFPFLKANCLACHNERKPKAGLILESPQEMLKGGDSGPAIVPGKGAESFLFSTAAHLEEPTMPPANNKSKAENLSPEQLALLKLWIDQGAKGGSVSTAAPESWTLLKGPQPIYTAAISGDGRFAAAGRGQQVHLYDLKLGRLAATLRDPGLEFPAADRDLVQVVAFSPDGRSLATGGYRVVKIWERAEASAGEAVALPADPGALSVSPDGKRSAIGSADGSILLVSHDDPKAAPGTVKDHAGAVTSLLFSPDGATLYSGSADKTVKSRPIAEPGKSTPLTLPAPVVSMALLHGGKQLLLASADQTLRIVSADLKSPLAYTPPPAPKPAPVPAPVPAPKPATPAPAPPAKPAPATPAPPAMPVTAKPGATAAPKPATPVVPNPPVKAAPATPAPAQKPAAAPAPNTPAKAPAPVVKPAAPATPAATPPASKSPTPAPEPASTKPILEFKPHPQAIVAVASIKADGSEFAAAYADGTVILFSSNPALPGDPPKELRRISHGAPLTRFAVSPLTNAEIHLATSGAGGAVKLWNPADGKMSLEYKADPLLAPKLASLTRETTISTRRKAYWDRVAPESAALVKAESEKAVQAGNDLALARRDLAAKQGALKKLENMVPATAEDALIKAREEVTVSSRTVSTAERNLELSSRLAGDAFARQTSAEAGSKESDGIIAALKVEGESLSKTSAEEEKKVNPLALAFSNDGTTLLQSLAGGTVRIYSTETAGWIEDFPVGREISALAATADRFVSVSTDKQWLSWALPGREWNLVTTLGDGKSDDPFVDRVTTLAFDPMGDRLLTGTGVPSRGGHIAVWDTANWTRLVANDEAHQDTITAFSFSPDGSRFASASTDKLIKIFETETLTELQTLEAHTSHVLDVSWNADDLTLASAGADLKVKIWNLSDGSVKSTVEGYSKEIGTVVYVGETETLLTASGDKTVKLANAPLPDAGDAFLHTADANQDGSLLIAGGQDSVLRVWDGKAKKLIVSFPSPQANSDKVAGK